jgi:hypothetical protein
LENIMNRIPWTEERQKQLCELAALRLSAAEIGERMGMTRNAIIGRCYRTDVALLNPDRGPSRGYRHHWAKLDEADVSRVTEALRANISCASIARSLGVSQKAIWHIKQGVNWKYVQ